MRHWHPGQDWIFKPGGLGVFDPGINALSIATHLLPAFALQHAQLAFPENRQAPISAVLSFATTDGAPIHASFDFLQTGLQTWDMRIDTDGGRLELSMGGAELRIDGADALPSGAANVLRAEYVGVYAEFAALIAARESGVDLRPMMHVADAFLRGERTRAPTFTW